MQNPATNTYKSISILEYWQVEHICNIESITYINTTGSIENQNNYGEKWQMESSPGHGGTNMRYLKK